MRPLYRHGTTALLLCLAGALGLVLLLRPAPTWFHYLAAWLLSVNVVAFAYYGYDKSCARSASRRVPEAVLHGLSFAGGSLGAYAGMQVFRHKTVKGSFRIFFWFVVVMQVLLIAAVVYRSLKHHP
jgi:uncharacterized membrane protein YsdA (DUF1294 family)